MVSEPRRVRDVMSSPVTTVPHTARLLEAVLALRSAKLRHLPIVDGDKVAGVISDRDVQRYAPSLLAEITPEEYNAIFENTPLERVMTRNPVAVSPDATVREAAEVMHEGKLGCLPVVEDGHLVGIITKADMLRILCGLLADCGSPSSREDD